MRLRVAGIGAGCRFRYAIHIRLRYAQWSGAAADANAALKEDEEIDEAGVSGVVAGDQDRQGGKQADDGHGDIAGHVASNEDQFRRAEVKESTVTLAIEAEGGLEQVDGGEAYAVEHRELGKLVRLLKGLLGRAEHNEGEEERER